ncbi:hypothetical protein A9Q02_21980 [Candidatus Chloroploca asiatica]|uniref:Methyltransferase FkbM domain-containing protein n=1 Tax=Candidatus Chloroploca asiatica TaxID=1506545 RepID=A0A2H3KRI0_9CHLR|nr:hypothetical protein A9Q02_21980 [Candidatus Chloroploca asiatica]
MLRRYRRVFGWRGLIYFWYGEMLRRQTEVSVTRPGSNPPIYLRLGTSDIGFYDEIFVRRVYDLQSVRPLQVIVDAGANIGLAARYFAEHHPHVRILAIEPAAANFGQLYKNVSACSQITPIQAALWHIDSELDLTNPVGRHGAFRVWNTASHSVPVQERVPTMTIPNLLANYNLERIDLLKIDIEGAEVELFANAGSWIDRVGIIAVELHDRLRRGCALNFYSATQSFDWEWHRGDLTFVARAGMVDKQLLRSV